MRRSGAAATAAALLFAAPLPAQTADPAALRLEARTLAAAGRYGDAAAALARARSLAPADRDIILAQARVALWSGRPALAARFADEAEALEPDHPDLPTLRASIRAARADGGAVGLTLVQGLSRVRLAGPDRTWFETALAIDAPLGSRTWLTAELERVDREVATDTRLSLRLDRRLASGSLYVAAATTPNADFRERWSLRGGGEARLAGPVVATLDARYADYGAAEVVAIEPGLRFQAPDGRYALAIRSINLWDERGDHRGGWAVRGELRPRERTLLFAGAATYPDTEAGVTRRVDAFFAGTRFALGTRAQLGLTAEHERREQSYRRTGVTLSLRWRFGG